MNYRQFIKILISSEHGGLITCRPSILEQVFLCYHGYTGTCYVDQTIAPPPPPVWGGLRPVPQSPQGRLQQEEFEF